MLIFAASPPAAGPSYRDLALASHEAGHAVAALELGMVVTGAGIDPPSVHDHPGWTDFHQASAERGERLAALGVLLRAGVAGHYWLAIGDRGFAGGGPCWVATAGQDDADLSSVWQTLGPAAGHTSYATFFLESSLAALRLTARRVADVDAVAAGLLARRTLTGAQIATIADAPDKRIALSTMIPGLFDHADEVTR